MPTKKTFEETIKELEGIVAELESGDLPLEKAIDKFEKGIQLSKLCSQKLEQTEKRLMMLLKDSQGEISETPYSPDAETDEDG